MERQSRLVYSEEQKEVLATFFNEGMTSTKKAMCDKIRACATRVGISEDQVKHWINNHNAKCSSGSRVLDGHKRTEKKLVRKQSGFNAFTREFLHKEQTGGSAEVFRTIGEKWRNLSDSDRDAYKKVATDLGSAVSLPSADKQAKKIIGNIMKQVAELETLGGHALMLCAYDGVCYQGSAGIGDSLLKTNIMETFASRLHCNSLVEKQDVSVKHLQEVFNFKYSELVGNRGSKMPYAKIQQLGILFNNLPLDLKKEIGVIPRKPSLYGSGQRRKLWLARHDWSFGISLPVPSMDSSTTPSATTHTSTSPTPTPSLVNSSTSC